MEEKNKDNLDRLSIKDGPSTLWSLPDFGDPLTTRNREEFHEPAQNYHYSDTEDKDEHKRRDSYFVPSNSAYFKKIGDKKTQKKKKKRKKKSEDVEEKKQNDKPEDPNVLARPKFPIVRIRTSSESRIDPIVHEAHAEESGEGEETEDVAQDEPSSIPSIPIILSEPVPSLPHPISDNLIQPEQAKIKLSIITEHGKMPPSL